MSDCVPACEMELMLFEVYLLAKDLATNRNIVVGRETLDAKNTVGRTGRAKDMDIL